MRRGLAGWLAILLLSGCQAEQPASQAPDLTPQPSSDSALTPPARPRRVVSVDTIARGLVVPWGIAFTPDGRALVTERPGRIRVIAADGLQEASWATLAVHSEFGTWGPESGLLGIALAPDFASSGHVYVMATVPVAGSGSARSGLRARLDRLLGRDAAFEYENQIVRFTERDGVGVEPVVIVGGLPAFHYHAGGGLAFGADGMLYASVGDAWRPPYAADSNALVGKILRYERDGSIPSDNPIPGSPVWARGLRNTQAFGWLPDGNLLGVEHGPTGSDAESGRMGHDELNVLRAGADYGWPRVVGWASSAGSSQPIWVWRDAIAPGGLAIERETAAPESAVILVAGLRFKLLLLSLERGTDGWMVRSGQELVAGDYGRLRTVAQAPDGTFWVTTSNRDGRGQAGPADDLVVRVRLSRD